MIPTDLSKVLKRKADISATGDATNFPAGTKNTYRVVSTGGSLGGAVGTGLTVAAGDILICHTTTVAGTYAAVGSKWGRIPQGGAMAKAVDLAVTTGVTNYPAAVKGDLYMVTTDARIGGAVGVGRKVVPGDLLYCWYTNAGGNEAAAGAYWTQTRQCVSFEDGQRSIELASNTIQPTLTNGLHVWNNVLYVVENSVHFPATYMLSKTTVSFAADGQTTLFTVPTGMRLIIDKVDIVAAADCGTTTCTIGKVGALTDFLGTQTLSGLDAQYDVASLRVIPNATPVVKKSYAAGTVIQIDVGAHAGAAGNLAILYGSLY